MIQGEGPKCGEYELQEYNAGEDQEMEGTRVWKRVWARAGEHEQGFVAAKSCRTLVVAFFDDEQKTLALNEETGEYEEDGVQTA